MSVPERRIVAAAIFLASLFPQWGLYDYTSSLSANGSNRPFTGLDAVRQQSMLECISCLGFLVLFFTWLCFRDLAVKRGPIPTPKGWGWDLVLLGILGSCSVAWVRILTLALTHDRDRFFVSSIWYTDDFSTGFWVFPAAVVLAIGVRFLPLPSPRAGGPSDFIADVQLENPTVLSRAEALLAHRVAIASGLLVSGMFFLLCSLLYLMFR